MDTDPLYVAVQTEDVEDAVCVHLQRFQPVNHDDRRISVSAVLARRRWRRSVARAVAPPPAPSHRRTHAATLIGRRAIALVVAVVTAS